MNVRIYSLLCLILAGCSLFKPQPAAKGKSFGVIDKEHAILLEDIAKLPKETIMKNYLGKTVTFKGIQPGGGTVTKGFLTKRTFVMDSSIVTMTNSEPHSRFGFMLIQK